MTDETKTKLVEAIGHLPMAIAVLFILGGMIYLNHKEDIVFKNVIGATLEQQVRTSAQTLEILKIMKDNQDRHTDFIEDHVIEILERKLSNNEC